MSCTEKGARGAHPWRWLSVYNNVQTTDTEEHANATGTGVGGVRVSHQWGSTVTHRRQDGFCHSCVNLNLRVSATQGAGKVLASPFPLSGFTVGALSGTKQSGDFWSKRVGLSRFAPSYPAVRSQVQTLETGMSLVPGCRRENELHQPCL